MMLIAILPNPLPPLPPHTHSANNFLYSSYELLLSGEIISSLCINS